MRSVVLIVPGRLDARSGGYEYDRRMAGGLRRAGWAVAVRELPGDFPHPEPAARDEAARILAGLSDRSIVLADGLALGVLPDEFGREASRLPVVALVHHPLALETGLDDRGVRALEESERQALSVVRKVIVTSRTTAEALAAYDVAPARIAVVEPGTDRAPIAVGSQSDRVHMLCVATLIPRKGHDLLIRALAGIAARNWQLTCVGGHQRDRATAERLGELLRETSLERYVTLAGEADAAAVEAYYNHSDLFVLPTLYEGYGMAVAEAIAHGLPVVSTRTGAIPEIVPRDAGVLVSPGDEAALADALSLVLASADLRAQLAHGARRARRALPTWDAAAAKLSAVLDAVARG